MQPHAGLPSARQGKYLVFTGHRPQKLVMAPHNPWDSAVQKRLVDLARATISQANPVEVVTGMALGWDRAVASAAIELGVPFIAALPCPGQSSFWRPASVRAYEDMLRFARGIVTVWQTPGYASNGVANQMQARNVWMIDRLIAATAAGLEGKLIALWDGSAGGTGNCLRYARSKGVAISNVWNSWKANSGFWKP